jgi:hypothetical protein
LTLQNPYLGVPALSRTRVDYQSIVCLKSCRGKKSKKELCEKCLINIENFNQNKMQHVVLEERVNHGICCDKASLSYISP